MRLKKKTNTVHWGKYKGAEVGTSAKPNLPSVRTSTPMLAWKGPSADNQALVPSFLEKFCPHLIETMQNGTNQSWMLLHPSTLLFNNNSFFVPLALTMEVTAISYLVSWLPSDPLWSPRSSKRGSRSSSGTSQTDTWKVSVTGGKPETLMMDYVEDSKARSFFFSA